MKQSDETTPNLGIIAALGQCCDTDILGSSHPGSKFPASITERSNLQAWMARLSNIWNLRLKKSHYSKEVQSE